MKRFYYSIFIFVCLLSLNGCGMVMMNAVGTVRGGENDYLIVEPVQNLESYKSIKLVSIKGQANKRLTPELLSYMNKKVHEELSSSGAKLRKKGHLRVSGKVLNIADSFRKKEILVQLSLHDIKTKQSLGVVNITGEASGLRGIKSAADEIAEGLTDILASYNYPGIKESSWF